MAYTRWTKQRVMEEIQRIYGKLPHSHPDRKRLYGAAQRHFGSWDAALKAAGVKPLQRTWSRAEIIQRIQREYPECGTAIWKDCAFKSATGHHFRSQTTALQAAGFSPNRIQWTREIIIQKVQAHAKQDPSFKGIRQQDTRLYVAAKRHFGSWRQAIQAAGVAPPRRWSRSAVIQAIKQRQQQNQPLSGIIRHDRSLYYAAVSHLGGWRLALIAAGVPVKVPRRWTEENVRRRLLELKHHPDSFTGSQHKSLHRASLRYFGSWAAALASVGIPRKPRQKWTPAKVLWETRLWHHESGGDRKPLPSPLRDAMVRYFGSTRNAFEAAGVPWPYDLKWSKTQVIETIQDRYINGHPIQQRSDVEESLSRAAQNCFGSWKRALIASGLESVYFSYPSRLTRDRVIDVVQTRYRQGLSMSWDDNRDLKTAVEKHFGSWFEAQVAAGVPPRQERWTRDRLARRIRDHLQQGPIPSHHRLRSAAFRHFGGWRNAVEEARLLEDT